MNASVLSLSRVRVLALALAIVGAGALSLMMTSTVFAAAPTGFASQTYSDSNGDGQVDRVVVQIATAGEDLTTCLVTDAEVTTDWVYGGGPTIGGGLVPGGDLHTCDLASETVTLVISGANADVTGGGTAPTIAYDNDDADNSIANGAGNLGNIAPQTIADGARPVLITTSPVNGATNVSRLASIVLTFSEAIAGGVTWTHTGGPEVGSFSAAGTSTVTLSHTALMSSGYHAVDVTVASDATGNLFNGAKAGIADPFSFTVISGTSATVTAPTYDIEVTAPNGGEELVPGTTQDITWESITTGASAMSFVNINISYQRDGSTVQETIVTGTANDGSYSWVVPAIDTDSATIQVVGTDLVESLATDESDSAFTIGTIASSSDDDASDSEDDSAPSSGTTGISPVTGEVEDISVVAYGDYIRSAYFDTVYFVDMDDNGDLIRRPFLDAQTFMTWENDWNDVETVTDATLPTLALGSPMLPKAGVVLIKIQSDARVFAVGENGSIRLLSTEAIAIDMYGADWADYVIDVAATLFPRFDIGDDIDRVEDMDTSDMKTRLEVNS